MLRGLLANEMQMTHLQLPWSGLPRDDLSTVYQQLGSLTALRYLCATDLPESQPNDDCCALRELRQLMTLIIPLQVCSLALLRCLAEICALACTC